MEPLGRQSDDTSLLESNTVKERPPDGKDISPGRNGNEQQPSKRMITQYCRIQEQNEEDRQ